MNLQDLTIAQIKNIESVIYQSTFTFTDSDLFEFIALLLTEDYNDNPEIELFQDGTQLVVDGDLTWWFENQISLRGLES